MPTIAPALAGTATFEFHGQLCEVKYVLSPERPEGGPWDGVPLAGSTLWKTGGNGADLLEAFVTGEAETETLWRCGDAVVSARFRLLLARPPGGPGVVVVPLGRRFVEIVVRAGGEVVAR